MRQILHERFDLTIADDIFAVHAFALAIWKNRNHRMPPVPSNPKIDTPYIIFGMSFPIFANLVFAGIGMHGGL